MGYEECEKCGDVFTRFDMECTYLGWFCLPCARKKGLLISEKTPEYYVFIPKSDWNDYLETQNKLYSEIRGLPINEVISKLQNELSELKQTMEKKQNEYKENLNFETLDPDYDSDSD